MSKKSKILFATASVVIAVILVFVFQIYSAMFSYKTIKLDDNLTILAGASCNSAVFTSNDKKQLIIIDPKMKTTARKMKRYISKLADNPDITIINTHSHYDHTEGNNIYPDAKIISGAYKKEQWEKESRSEKMPDIQINPENENIINMDDEKIIIRNMGQAHTYNDVIVYFENRKILFTGDILFNRMHPAMFKESGSDINKWITVLESLLTTYNTETVIPGHGNYGDKTIINSMKDYFVSIQKAENNEEELKLLRKKYKNYFSIPGISGFDRTLEFSK